jgi:hypothetical protein
MTAFPYKMKLIILALIFITPAIALSGCIGGPIAQQLVTSLITRGVDTIANNAYDAQLRDEKLAAERSHVLKDTIPDPYYFAFATAGFETITPVIETLPNKGSAASDKNLGIATSIAPNGPSSADSLNTPSSNTTSSRRNDTITAANPSNNNAGAARITRLVRVEIWNLVIGDEKMQILEKARLLGEPLPSKDKWHSWRVATGLVENTEKPITFLIPPDLGFIHSGDRAVVEVTAADHLYIARYAAN